MQDILITSGIAIIGILMTALVAYVRVVVNRFMIRIEASEAEKQAVEALISGVAFAQEDLVIGLKRATEDGKLSTEERQAARDLAISHALTLAKGPGLDILKTASRERLDGWIKEILARWTKK